MHQYRSLKKLKDTLKLNELLVHIDFSENYSFKYGREIQSYHFGGSQQQVTLHTVIAYYREDEDADLEVEPICTITECLQHDPAAVSVHMYPVLHYLFSKLPFVGTLFIFSDGPSNQYRNKNIFFYISTTLPKIFPHLDKISWNYSECGHGKGAPDGLGGTLK